MVDARARGSALLSFFVSACVTSAAPKEARTSADASESTQSAGDARVVERARRPSADPNSTPSSSGTAAPRAASERSVEFRSLAVPGFGASVLALPSGDERLGLVIATHGAGGDPEYACRAWAIRTRGRAIVLCPRGRAISVREPQGFYYPDHRELRAEVLAALDALEREYGARLARRAALYTGYSQGATMGALFVPEYADRFPALVLTEGGYSEWPLAQARAFKAHGGARVVLACGTRHCAERAKTSAETLEHAGISTRLVYVEGAGHTDGGPIGDRLDELWTWANEAVEQAN